MDADRHAGRERGGGSAASDADSQATRALSVADVLRARIFEGGIEPDTHLMEVSLSRELGVSRTPVREALGKLADEGLLHYLPNRGFVVRRFTSKDVSDSFEVRASLESLGCRLVGERGLRGDAHHRLRHMVAEQDAVLAAEPWTRERALRWQQLNLDFHYALLELANNDWLTRAVRQTRKLPIVFDSQSRPRDRDAYQLLYARHHSRQAAAEHGRIVEALSRREASRAAALMAEHILTNRDVLVHALLEDDGPPSDRESGVSA